MARGYRLLTNRNRLIPRIEVLCRSRDWVKGSSTSIYKNAKREVQFTEFTAVECSVQPVRGKALRDQNNQLMVEGEQDYDSYTVYSETLLHRAKEGTDGLSDQMYLPDTGGGHTWFTVMKIDIFVSSGVSRYKYYVVAVPVGTDGGM